MSLRFDEKRCRMEQFTDRTSQFRFRFRAQAASFTNDPFDQRVMIVLQERGRAL